MQHRTAAMWHELPLPDHSFIRLEHVTYGKVHRVAGGYEIYTSDSPDALMFWLHRRMRTHKRGMIGQGLWADVVDAAGQIHRVRPRTWPGHYGPPGYERDDVWELPHLLPFGEPFRLRLYFFDRQTDMPKHTVEFELFPSPEWIDDLIAKAQAYDASPQRLHDDLVMALWSLWDKDKDQEAVWETVRDRIHQGARLPDVIPIGYNDLHLTILENDTDLALYLIKHGADVNKPTGIAGQSPLMLAVVRRNEELVRALLERGASVYAKDDGGRTVLDWAKKAGHKSILRLLEQAGAKE